MADWMTSKERMKNLVLKKEIDRVPFNPSSSLQTAYLAGVSAKEFYMKPEVSYFTQKWAQEMYGYDATPDFDIPDYAGWDFGRNLVVSEKNKLSYPVLTSQIVKKPSDIEKVKLPDLKIAPGFQRLRRFSEISVQNGGMVSLPGGSPMSVARCILGVENLLRWVVKEPEVVRMALQLATEYIISMGDYLIDEFGVEKCQVFAAYPVDSHELLAPKWFEKYTLPHTKKLQEHLLSRGVKNWGVHLCGKHEHNIGFWKNELKLPERTIFAISDKMDIKKWADFMGEDYIISGNVKTEVLSMGTPTDVYDASARVVEEMKYFPGGFMLTPGCQTPPHTPALNIYAMLKAARDYGKY